MTVCRACGHENAELETVWVALPRQRPDGSSRLVTVATTLVTCRRCQLIVVGQHERPVAMIRPAHNLRRA
jgi:hypothetical protein